MGGVAPRRSGDLRDRRHGLAAVAAAHRVARADPLRASAMAAAMGSRRLRVGPASTVSGGQSRSAAASSVEYLEQTRGAIDFNRPGIPIVASLPSVHIADTYGKAHHGRPGTVAAITEWADQHDVPLVDLKAAVAEHVLSGRGNPDGIHWNFEAHQAVAELMLKALAEAGIEAEKPRG